MTDKLNPFREAIPYIWLPKTEAEVLTKIPEFKTNFTCFALRAVALDRFELYGPEYNLMIAARDYVQACVDGYFTLEAFLAFNGYIKLEDGVRVSLKDQIKIQAHRKAWLEKLADDYDAGLIKL